MNKDNHLIWEAFQNRLPSAGPDAALKNTGPGENAEEQNRIVGNDVIQNDQVIGEFLGDSYSSKLTLNGKQMFMPGAPYAQTVNQGTHMGLWYKNKRHKLVVKDASKWKEFLSDIVATGDDKYWDGKKMHQHDHIGDEISATNEYWSKKIAAGADQSPAENAEGMSDAEYHKARKDAFEGAGEELGHGPIKVQLKKNTTIDCYKAGTVQGVRFAKGTIFNCDVNVGDYYECDTEEYGGVAVFPYDVTVLSGEENAESADEKKERVQRGWDINKKRWTKWKAENPEAAAKHAAKKAGKSEDAEHRSKAQQAAIAISLQKAGKKPS